MTMYIISHEVAKTIPCADGLVSAWIASKRFPGAILKGAVYQDIEMYPDYANPGDEVLIVDFSFPRSVIQGLIDRDVKVTVIDHHEGAFNDLSNFTARFYRYHYDVTKCGATLTWERFFPGVEPPGFLKYIQANDIRDDFYYDNYENVKCVTSAIWQSRQSFTTYEAIANMDEDDLLKAIVEDGKALWEVKKSAIKELLKEVVFEDFEEFVKVPTLRLLSKHLAYRSDLAEIYLMENRQHPFMLLSNKKMTRFHLRSYKRSSNAVAVNEICSRFGGGGHVNSAGFRL